jgi:hypothetical protein
MINRTNLTSILTAGVIALTSNQANSQQIQFDETKLDSNYNIPNMIRNISWIEGENIQSQKQANTQIPLINELIQTYTPNDFKELNARLQVYNQINGVNRKITEINERTDKFYDATELGEVCKQYQTSKICSEKVLVSNQGKDYYYLQPQVTLKTVRFSLPDLFTKTKNTKQAEQTQKYDRQKLEKYEKHYQTTNGKINPNNFKSRWGGLSMEDSYICIKDTMNFVDNDFLLPDALQVKSNWDAGIRAEEKYERQIKSLPKLIKSYQKQLDGEIKKGANDRRLNLIQDELLRQKEKLKSAQQNLAPLKLKNKQIYTRIEQSEDKVNKQIEQYNNPQLNQCVNQNLSKWTVDSYCNVNKCTYLKSVGTFLEMKGGQTSHFKITPLEKYDAFKFRQSN